MPATLEQKSRVFMTGRSQAVRIPADCRFSTDEVFVRRDLQTGDLVLSEAPGEWEDIFAACDKAALPDSFLAERDQDLPQARDL